MLEVIECFFTGQSLTEELNEIYEKYHENRGWDEEQGLGFISHEDKSLEEITQEIIKNIKQEYTTESKYYLDYLLKKHVNSPDFNKERILKDVEKYGHVLLWCNKEFKNDKDIVLAAVKQNKEVIVFASEDIKSVIGQGDPVKSLEALIMNEKYETLFPPKNTQERKRKI